MVLSETVIILIIGTIGGLFALAFKLCYMSKCRVIKFKDTEIQRDTSHEIDLNINDLTLQKENKSEVEL